MNRTVCVYCASSTRVDAAYLDVARDMGTRLVAGGFDLVYGGGDIGLMGAVARAVHDAGGRVTGVIPDTLMDKEIAYADADEMIVTANMRDRKATMEDRADAFVTLPGGWGTLEELMEILTGKALGYHGKPVIIVNAMAFYDPLVDLFEHMHQTRFAREHYRALYDVVDTPELAIDVLAASLSSPA